MHRCGGRKFCFWFSSDLINFVVCLFLCTVFYSNSLEWEGYKYKTDTCTTLRKQLKIYTIV